MPIDNDLALMMEDETVTDEGTENLEDQETEEPETDEETDDEEPEEEPEDKADKASPKAEKRIASLTAQLKAAKEENSDLREEITHLETETEKLETRYSNQFPDNQLLKYEGKPLAELSQADYHKALRNINRMEVTPEQRQTLLDMAIEQREKAIPIQEAKAEISAKQSQTWNNEWIAVENALKDPDLMGDKVAKLFSENVAKIKDAIQDDLDGKKFAKKQLIEADVEGKFEYAIKIAKKLGLINKAQLTAYEERPALKVPLGTGKGKKTPTTAGGKRIWSEAEIDSMSLKEYSKNEKAIDEALADGRVR